MEIEKTDGASGASCECSSPKLVVEVGGHHYHAVPVDPREAPACRCCSAPYTGPWKVGQAVNMNNPYRCGQPKKDGSPCGWIITTSPCAVHLTPEDLERERLHQEREEERASAAEVQRNENTEVRRRNIIAILSVTCPHCSVPAGELCRNPQGVLVRVFHRARRLLAGVSGPKDFVIEATSPYHMVVTQPPLDADLRELLGDPLEDRTAEATVRFVAEVEEAAERKLQKARRELWLASAPRDQEVTAVACTVCGVPEGVACVREGKLVKRAHPERIDHAMNQT
ncbi:hypothetical protein ABZY02_35200 [Streptomyces sp. NPDC006649]|uniref:zinc finger domain-containing protein n=1 Tax=Streptomyces sp. NPDC006649 TaxID=3156896 RepID=UPI0033A79AD1